MIFAPFFVNNVEYHLTIFHKGDILILLGKLDFRLSHYLFIFDLHTVLISFHSDHILRPEILAELIISLWVPQCLLLHKPMELLAICAWKFKVVVLARLSILNIDSDILALLTPLVLLVIHRLALAVIRGLVWEQWLALLLLLTSILGHSNI